MGLFSFLRRKKKSSPALTKAEHSLPPEPPLKKWQHWISHFTLQTHPLGNTPGTHLEKKLLMSVLVSLSKAISLHENEAQESHSPYFALSRELLKKASEDDQQLIDELDVVGLSFDMSHGHAARVSANSRKYTVLFGESGAVARASTPFHEDLQKFLSECELLTSKPRIFVLAVDGIAYAALALASELK